MQKILIVNSDIEQCTLLKKTIQSTFPNWKIETVHCYLDGKLCISESIKNEDYFTLFFLDKDLPKTHENHNSYVLAEFIRKNPAYYITPMIFFTNTSEDNLYAFSHFHCYNCFLKPYSQEQILEEIHQMLFMKVLKPKHLEIKDTNRVLYSVPQNDILYFTSDAPHILKIVTKDNLFHTREYTIKGLLHKLGFPFVRCHKKYVINKEYLYCVDKCSSHLEINDYTIPIGKTYLNQF